MLLLAFEPPFQPAALWWLMLSTFVIGIGFGIVSPAGRNAGIQLAPEQSAEIAAVRSLGLQLGQNTAIAAATASIAGAKNAAMAQATVYAGLHVILIILLLPVISRISDNQGSL